MGRQARFDVTQALPQRELGEGESAEVLGARQVADSPVPGVTVCDASEGRPRKEAHDLSEESFASVHPDKTMKLAYARQFDWQVAGPLKTVRT